VREKAPIIDSRIEQVTVFRLGAEVIRVAEIDLPERYPAEVVIPGLPLQLRDETLQLAVEPCDGAPAEACPLAVDVQIGLEPPPPDSSLPPATDAELREAERDKTRSERELAQLQEELSALDSLTSPARPEPAEGEPPAQSPTAARLALLDFEQEERDRLHALLEPARERLRQAREALEQLKARRDAQREQRQLRPHELRKRARVGLQAPLRTVDGARCRLRISYLVPAARWAPCYTLHIGSGGALELAMRAQVSQLSGEDWREARLALSSADAMQWAELPELHALRIGRAQAAPPSAGWRPAPTGADALYQDYRDARADQAGPVGGSVPIAPAPTSRAVPVAACAPEAEELEESMELQAACAPAPAEAPRAKRRRSMPPRAAKASFAANRAPPAPQAAMSMDSLSDAPVSGGAYGGPPPPPTAIEAGRDLLDYDGLRMAGPDEASPGRLRPVSSLARYRELLPAALRRRLPPDHELLARRDDDAHRLSAMPLPAGHQAPRSLDAFDHAWRGEQPVDVPSDGRFHSVPVLRCEATGHVSYVSVPREATEVFRVVRLRNPLAAPLLAGPVDVYMDEDYLLAAALGTVPGRGEIELGLGVEEGIRVARNTRFEERQRGMVSRHQDLLHELEIELRNLLAKPAMVEVRERVPVVREDDEEIEVALRSAEPPWEPWDQPDAPLRGAHRWRVELQPGQVRQLRAQYVVSISPKHELVGGNRREA
jgi:hypothetical protein